MIMKLYINIKGIIYKIWNFLYYWSDLTEIFTQYVKSKKKNYVHEFFFHLGLSFIYTGCNRNAGTKLNHAYKN